MKNMIGGLDMKLKEKLGTYQRFEFANVEELKELIKEYGNPKNMEDQHNDAPVMKDCFIFGMKHKDKIRFGGYIIHKPREDYRVSVDEVIILKYNEKKDKQIFEAIRKVSGTPDKTWTDKLGNLHVWWD